MFNGSPYQAKGAEYNFDLDMCVCGHSIHDHSPYVFDCYLCDCEGFCND